MLPVDTRRILVTGASGNLGSKLVAFLSGEDWVERVIAVDRHPLTRDAGDQNRARVESRAVDLSTCGRAEMAALCAGVDSIVHFAVVNSTPDSTWEEAVRSFDMTAELLLAARAAGVKRFVFASSNHAVGALRDHPLASTPGAIETGIFAPGTRWETLDGMVDAHAYGAGKVFCERLCRALAERDGMSTVSIRIGWCQVGENHPATINAGGNPALSAAGRTARSGANELAWFRNMWLSDRDFASLFACALCAGPEGWPEPGIVVNGVSANAGMPWEIASAGALIGYVPVDNVWDHVRHE